MKVDLTKYLNAWNPPPSIAPRACFCRGPQNGDPVCPCAMPAYLERQAGKEALDILSRLRTKPRIRVKAISVPA